METIKIPIKTPFIRLDSLLKFSNLCQSGGEAKERIQGGEVKVNGETCLARGKKCVPGDKILFENTEVEITSCS